MRQMRFSGKGIIGLSLLIFLSLVAWITNFGSVIQSSETILQFFYLVNKTGRVVQVRVLADGQELFVQQIDAPAPSSPGQEVPPVASNAAVELKIPVSKDAKRLEVQELRHVGTRAVQATFDIPGFSQVNAGVRITIREDGILLTQDYLPIRVRGTR